MNFADWQSLLGLLMGLLSFSGGILMWYRGSVEKRYASERAFNHIRASQEQIAHALDMLESEIDSRLDRQTGELMQVKMLLAAILAKSGDSASEILRSTN